jgi:hypothetical protein
MKLLLCKNCGDIFNLSENEKTCKCRKTKGRYIDRLNAVYSGAYAVPLGILNHSIRKAIFNQPDNGMGYNFEAFVIPKECDTMIKEDK